MRLIKKFYLNVTIDHYLVFVITCDRYPMLILVKIIRKKYVIMNILEEFYLEDTQLQRM